MTDERRRRGDAWSPVRKWVVGIIGAVAVTIVSSWVLSVGQKVEAVTIMPSQMDSLLTLQRNHVEMTEQYGREEIQYLCVIAAHSTAEERLCALPGHHFR